MVALEVQVVEVSERRYEIGYLCKCDVPIAVLVARFDVFDKDGFSTHNNFIRGIGMEILDSPRARTALEAVRNHPVLESFKKPVDRSLLVAAASQYWYPISEFPTFLGNAVGAVGDLETQNLIASILWEEVGQGRAEDSHTQIFVDTFEMAGVNPADIVDCAQTSATEHLMNVYRSSTATRAGAIGALLATEAIDLCIVEGLGTGLRQHVPGDGPLPWVDIHVEQEPGHTENSESAASDALDLAEAERIEAAAIQMWEAWADFFSAVPSVALVDA